MAEEYSIKEEPAGIDRFAESKCTGCGYELTGLEERGRCPECGATYGEELVITGFTNRGGPVTPLVLGGLILLAGLSELILDPFRAGLLSAVNVCSITGLILLGSGLLAVSHGRKHGGNLRWVLGPKGLHTIRGSGGMLTAVPWEEIKGFRTPWQLSLIPGGWRLLKLRRRWSSVDLLRRRSPSLWLKGRSRKDMLELVARCNRILRQRTERGPDPGGSREG